MNVRNAAVRAVRTFCQALAGLLLSFPVFANVLDVEVALRAALPVAVANALLVAFIAFLQNIAEDNTDVDVPK